MRLELPDILGLTIGFTLGGLGLVIVVLTAQEPAPPPAPVSVVAMPPPSPPRQAAVSPPFTRSHPPVIRPEPPTVRLTPSLPGQMATLPNVHRPSGPASARPANLSGTGFFIARNGTILTAAHVVAGCGTIQITSPHLPWIEAKTLAVDPAADLALLRAPIHPPALLALADGRTGGGDLVVYGYPAQGDPLIPTETTARARPDLGRMSGWISNPGLWIEAGAVRPGFSGGPVVTADGAAIGLIKGVVLRSATPTTGTPGIGTPGIGTPGIGTPGIGAPGTEAVPSGIAIGPDTRAITAFLRQEAPDLEIETSWNQQAGDPDAARKAVVHVLCRR